MKAQIDLTTTSVYFDVKTRNIEFRTMPEWICWNGEPRPHANLRIKDWQAKDYLRLYDFQAYDVNTVFQYNSDFDESTRFNFNPL
ncbi:hypothetical protein [Stenotrophomonas phage RAS14]